MRILALDAALACCSAAATDDDCIRAERWAATDRGHAALLPGMVAAVLAEAGWQARTLDLLAVTVGPGSFTGIRAALSLALGLGFAAEVEVAGITVGEALAAAGPLQSRQLWSAIDSKRGRVFIERDGAVVSCELDRLPMPSGPIALAGDAAEAVAARLSAGGADVRLTGLRLPRAPMVAIAALRRARAGAGLRPAQPLYVEGAETRLPSHPPRPPPVP